MRAYLIGEPRDDLVLHVEQVGYRLIETLRPEMMAALGVDELDVDAHSASAALDAALQNIADVEFAPDRLHVKRLAFEGKRSVPGDHERAADPG